MVGETVDGPILCLKDIPGHVKPMYNGAGANECHAGTGDCCSGWQVTRTESEASTGKQERLEACKETWRCS